LAGADLNMNAKKALFFLNAHLLERDF